LILGVRGLHEMVLNFICVEIKSLRKRRESIERREERIGILRFKIVFKCFFRSF
jgi:hypothetical protein